MKDYRQVLKEYWGYDSFRGIQEEIIESIGNGHDTLGLMPTGGGKSITFQVPALAQPGLCLVVTPLIALMKDQVRNLRERGIKAVAVYSGMTREEILVALDNCILGDYKFLYISPERLGTEIFQTKLMRMPVSMITVDEAHCISQWGYDFRPSYLQIAGIRRLLPGIPILALTATATPEVVDDILKCLDFHDGNVFRMSFERKNLAYIVRRTDNKTGMLLRILNGVPGTAIVYTRNRKRTKEVAEWLEQNGIRATYYHAGLSDASKDERQKLWVEGECRVMVATNAFGMGIDKPDVRAVVHMDFPDSPEAYFQEAGRAGRDGAKAYAVLLSASGDLTSLRKRIEDAFPPKEYVKKVYEDINFYYQMAVGDGMGCTYAFDIEDFCIHFKHFPLRAHSALKILTRAGYLEYVEEQDSSSRLMFTLQRDELYLIHDEDPEIDRLISALLRSYTGLFADYASIDEAYLAKQLGLSRQEVYNMLVFLAKRRILHYIPGKKTPYIIYTRERQDTSRVHLTRAVYEDRKEAYAKRVEAMAAYAENTSTCRSRMLLHYFGERNEHNCGQCDVCLQMHASGLPKGVYEETAAQILKALRESPLRAGELAERLKDGEDLARKALAYLLAEEKVCCKDGIYAVNEAASRGEK